MLTVLLMISLLDSILPVSSLDIAGVVLIFNLNCLAGVEIEELQIPSESLCFS